MLSPFAKKHYGQVTWLRNNALLVLSDSFSHQEIFAGLQALLSRQLVHFSQSVSRVEGRFTHGRGEISAHLLLGAAAYTGECSCKQKKCIHLAALAIEHLAQPESEFSARSRRNDTAIRLFRSEFSQYYDPFPAMARHRVIYLLKVIDDGIELSVYKGYLTKEGRYQLRGELGLDVVQSQPTPKYISLADRQIFALLAASLNSYDLETQRGQICTLLPKSLGQAFYQLITATQRCFFEEVGAIPLKLERFYDEDYFDRQLMVAVSHDVYIDECSHSLLFDCADDARINHHLLDDIDRDGEWSPRLMIKRQMMDFPWLSDPIEPVEFAKFYLVHGKRAYTLDELLYISADHTALMALVAKSQLQLHQFPLVSHRHESPISLALDSSARLLPEAIDLQAVALRKLSLAGWQIDFEAKNRFVKVQSHTWFADVEAQPDQDWFELGIGVDIDGKKVNLLPLLLNLIRQGKISAEIGGKPVTVELDSGELLTLPADRVKRILSVLGELYEKQPLNDSQRLRLSRHQLSRLSELDKAILGSSSSKTEVLRWQGASWLREKAQALNRFLETSSDNTDFVAPKGLNAVLRSYQCQGVKWLQFLKKHKFAGILADDMGLGKTIQTLTSIALDKEAGKLSQPILVIAPTTLLSNWQHEAKTFTPDLTTLVWSGRARHINANQLNQVDIVIISYGTLLQDEALFMAQQWYQVILDEAQTIKNSRSRVTKLVNKLNTKHRLCLTGTPMENHLGELWSLFHFLMPGFLGSASQYQRQFKLPIEKEASVTARQRLASRIAPFMLRRTKSKVVKELPEKTVINTVIPLSQTQTDLYETIRLTVAEQLQLALLETGAKANRLAISNALLKLRQVCCHPSMLATLAVTETDTEAEALTLKAENTTSVNESSKLTWLADKLPNMIEEGRNILIFSSFTTMLDLIAAQLDHLAIGYEMLTGKSRHRDKIISRFRSGEVNVFLISLKAGGSGLNLTEADIVIHVDPWWNPAAEEQASDRAYRIGQQKPVFVYKLICKNTVEERIQQLQQSKHALAQSMYQTDALSVAEMDRDDWLALLQPITDQTNDA